MHRNKVKYTQVYQAVEKGELDVQLKAVTGPRKAKV